jgi:membrane-associated phospholipid phosphatase
MPGSRPSALLALAVGVLGVVVLALTLPHIGPSPADLLDPNFRSLVAGLGPLWDALNTAGQLPIWGALVVIAAAIVFFVQRRRELAVELLIASAASEGISSLVRLVVDRPRPQLAQATDLLIAAGFPSGHVARAVVFGAALLFVLPWLQRHRAVWVVLAVVLVALMAVARVFASAHYSTDVTGGALLGAAVVAAWSLLTRLRRSAAAG